MSVCKQLISDEKKDNLIKKTITHTSKTAIFCTHEVNNVLVFRSSHKLTNMIVLALIAAAFMNGNILNIMSY